MLQRNGTKFHACLTSATRERAAATDDRGTPDFFSNKSSMGLAASLVYRERVELSPANVPHAEFDTVRCARCGGPTRLELIEVADRRERHTFECLACGFDQVHDKAG